MNGRDYVGCTSLSPSPAPSYLLSEGVERPGCDTGVNTPSLLGQWGPSVVIHGKTSLPWTLYSIARGSLIGLSFALG